jgi:hypothetical protein
LAKRRALVRCVTVCFVPALDKAAIPASSWEVRPSRPIQVKARAAAASLPPPQRDSARVPRETAPEPGWFRMGWALEPFFPREFFTHGRAGRHGRRGRCFVEMGVWAPPHVSDSDRDAQLDPHTKRFHPLPTRLQPHSLTQSLFFSEGTSTRCRLLPLLSVSSRRKATLSSPRRSMSRRSNGTPRP